VQSGFRAVRLLSVLSNDLRLYMCTHASTWSSTLAASLVSYRTLASKELGATGHKIANLESRRVSRRFVTSVLPIDHI